MHILLTHFFYTSTGGKGREDGNKRKIKGKKGSSFREDWWKGNKYENENHHS